jgi:hypothetical protein
VRPAPPAPPGSVNVFGPIKLEAHAEVLRHEVGWLADFASARRSTTLALTLSQDRAVCPKDGNLALTKDAFGCQGSSAMPASCQVESTVRVRTEVTLPTELAFVYRCNNGLTFSPGEHSRTEMSTFGVQCFREQNRGKPEAQWQSVYDLIGVQIAETDVDAHTEFPAMLSEVTGAKSTFCREDRAYLDGTAGGAKPSPWPHALAHAAAKDLLPADSLAASQAVAAMIPLTHGEFVSEHDLWNACQGGPPSPIVQERCLLLRQLDRFLRDVEDVARSKTEVGN